VIDVAESALTTAFTVPNFTERGVAEPGPVDRHQGAAGRRPEVRGQARDHGTSLLGASFRLGGADHGDAREGGHEDRYGRAECKRAYQSGHASMVYNVAPGLASLRA
jgi:hypothetical protein